ncbi:MAG: nucleotidyltransferase family protein [Acidobacteriia bacterium]|nr:nucleotidyltransferase family protein [Terriglobia bacterium]
MSEPWPTPLQEQVLLAGLGDGTEGSRALRAASSAGGEDALDDACLALLPLLYRRWAGSESELVLAGKKAHLAVWRQNQDRLLHLASLVGDFEAAGIPVLVLKGAALVLRHYRDAGLRSMRDFDVLVHERDLDAAIGRLERAGYAAEGNYRKCDVLRRMRVGHAWQFSRGDQSCDLHWRPVVRCYSPEVTRLFWQGAESVTAADRAVRVPSPTEQLFHVCVHGLQWDWVPQVRWIADALTVLGEPIDWDRLCHLAEAAAMRVRLSRALRYLQVRFAAPVPEGLAERLAGMAPRWEQREYRLLLERCPLGPWDSVAWHLHHFRRIRPFDAAWSHAPAWVGFPQYVGAFLDARGFSAALRQLWLACKLRYKARRA